MGTIDACLIGGLGGFAAELAQWFRLRRTLHRGLPDWSKSWLYWVLTLLMVGIGAVLVWLHIQIGGPMNAFLAFNIGLSAPLILTNLSGQIPRIEPGTSN